MTRLYLESSAALAWLLDEAAAPPVEALLTAAELVTASELTLLEVERVLVRALADGRLTADEAGRSRALLHRASEYWVLQALGRPVVERAGQPFPIEPIRTLDALHLASALQASAVVPGLTMLSLDRRVRENASALGLRVLP